MYTGIVNSRIHVHLGDYQVLPNGSPRRNNPGLIWFNALAGVCNFSVQTIHSSMIRKWQPCIFSVDSACRGLQMIRPHFLSCCCAGWLLNVHSADAHLGADPGAHSEPADGVNSTLQPVLQTVRTYSNGAFKNIQIWKEDAHLNCKN